MADSNKKTNYSVIAVFGLISVVGAALDIWNFAKVGFASLALGTAYLVYLAVKSDKVDPENSILASIRESEEKQAGEQVNSILDEIEAWLRTLGIEIYIDPYNSEINRLYIPSLESEQLSFYSFILQDKDSWQDLHVVIEAESQSIVHYGAVKAMPSELFYPQDYIPAIMTLVDNQEQKTRKSIKDSLQELRAGQLEGDYDFGQIDVDKTVDRDDGVLEAKTTR